MAQTRWQKLFAPATYGGLVNGGPVRELLTLGEVGGADLVGHEVKHYLLADSVLARVFGTRAEFMPWRNTVSFKTFPRLGVYLGSAIDSERPTATAVELLTIYVTIWWDAKVAEDVPDGHASVATVSDQVKRVLRADKARTLVVWKDGSERGMVNNVEEMGPERFAPFTLGGERVAGFLSELPVTYRLHKDRTAVVPYNLF